MAVARDAVIWAYRLLLGRNPESDAAVAAKMAAKDEGNLMRELTGSPEFRSRQRDKVLFGAVEKPPPVRLHLAQTGPWRTISFDQLPAHCCINGAEKIPGTIRFPAAEQSKLADITVTFHGDRARPEDLAGVEIDLQSIPLLRLSISDSHQQVRVGKDCTGEWTLRLWGRCSVDIGDRVTSNGVDAFVNPGGALVIGEDCMFAQASLHVGDNHALIDAATGTPLNYSDSPRIEFRPHVWIASRVMVFADSVIGAGSVLGAGSVVKGDFPGRALIAGCPAKLIREGVTWTRSHNGVEAQDVLRELATR